MLLLSSTPQASPGGGLDTHAARMRGHGKVVPCGRAGIAVCGRNHAKETMQKGPCRRNHAKAGLGGKPSKAR